MSSDNDEGKFPIEEEPQDGLEEHDKLERSNVKKGEEQPQGGFIAAATAIPGVLLGYRKNLRNQNLTDIACQDLRVPLNKSTTINGYEVSIDIHDIQVASSDNLLETLSYVTGSVDEAAEIDSRYDIDNAVEQLVSDLPQIDDKDYEFEYYTVYDFFDRLETGKTRPFTVDLLRGFDGADPSIVREFTGANTTDPKEVIQKLKVSFADNTSYDIPRYIAGSISDNLLFRAVPLRSLFEHDVDYQTLLSSSNTRMFCYEFTYRAIEALHAVSAHHQTYPVFGVGVHDNQHKHYYLGVGSVIRENNRLVIPMTFLDYTRTTLGSAFGIKGLVDTQLNAYDSHHYLTRVDWGR